MPLPPLDGLPFKINEYHDVDEPVFDPVIHLDLEMPEYVRIFPDFQAVAKTPKFTPDTMGYTFAYSAPFQVNTCNHFIRRDTFEVIHRFSF